MNVLILVICFYFGGEEVCYSRLFHANGSFRDIWSILLSLIGDISRIHVQGVERSHLPNFFKRFPVLIWSFCFLIKPIIFKNCLLNTTYKHENLFKEQYQSYNILFLYLLNYIDKISWCTKKVNLCTSQRKIPASWKENENLKKFQGLWLDLKLKVNETLE